MIWSKWRPSKKTRRCCICTVPLAIVLLVFAAFYRPRCAGFFICEEESSLLQKEIIELSERYVRILARQPHNKFQSPDELLSHDLKRVLAVLLDRALVRLHGLERSIDVVCFNTTTVKPRKQ